MTPQPRLNDYLVAGLALGFGFGIALGLVGGGLFHAWEWRQIAEAKRYTPATLRNALSYDYAGALYYLEGAVVGAGAGAVLGMLTAGVVYYSVQRQRPIGGE